MIPYAISGDVLTMILDGNSVNVRKGDPRFGAIVKCIDEGDKKKLKKCLDIKQALSTFVGSGKAEVKNGEVLFSGTPVHGNIKKRILEFMSEGFPFKPLLRFLEWSFQNPSIESRKELFDFLEHNDIKIDSAGYIWAYKAITDDWKDKHSQTISNKVGNFVKVDRDSVDPNRFAACSHGLHVGSMGYVRSFWNNCGKIIYVRINPKDVVSVPKDHSCMKMRVCAYQVMAEFREMLDDEKLLDDVRVQLLNDVKVQKYGLKPDGSKYHNVRDSKGRFVASK